MIVQVDAEMVAEVAKLGFSREMVVDSLRKRHQNKVRPLPGAAPAVGARAQ